MLLGKVRLLSAFEKLNCTLVCMVERFASTTRQGKNVNTRVKILIRGWDIINVGRTHAKSDKRKRVQRKGAAGTWISHNFVVYTFDCNAYRRGCASHLICIYYFIYSYFVNGIFFSFCYSLPFSISCRFESLSILCYMRIIIIESSN